MADQLTADEIRSLLKLEPNATCGYVRETYLSKPSIAPGRPAGALRRWAASRLCALFHDVPGRAGKASPHQEPSALSPLSRRPDRVLTLHDDGTHTLAVLGSDLRVGQRVQLFIPGSTFHTARIIGQRRWFLGASTEWPGVVPPRRRARRCGAHSRRSHPMSPPRSAASFACELAAVGS